MYVYLHGIDDCSKYLRELITRDRISNLDPSYIASKINKLNNEIKQLNELKASNFIDINNIEINKLLKYHAPNYKRNATSRTEDNRHFFIKKAIMPGLKKLGFKGSPQEIDELLLNYPEDDIHV